MPGRRFTRVEKGIFGLGPRGDRIILVCWQEGYAAFTVSATAREGVQVYVANQEHHHGTRTFREELVEMLEKAQKYDARYLD